jgi:acyl-CoA thioester hydrolase
LPDWLDYNGHMTEHRYLQAFGESSDALYEELGVDFSQAEVGAYYTAATHIRHLKEARLDTLLWSSTEILGYDAKRLHLLHSLYDATDALLATGEHLSLHVAFGKSCAASEAVLSRIVELYAPLAEVPCSAQTGSVLTRQLQNARPKQA